MSFFPPLQHHYNHLINKGHQDHGFPEKNGKKEDLILRKKKNQENAFLQIFSLETVLCVCLGWRLLRCVSVSTFSPFFFLFFFHAVSLSQAVTVHVRYINSSSNFWPDFREQYIRALFTDPQIFFFMNFFIKNGSHSTIYTFKNYFTTVISAISFQFQQIKSYPNRP